MKEEIKYSILKFKDALIRLKEGVFSAREELQKDGVIQRFEFTFELFGKSLRMILEDQGIPCRTPKECLKSAFKIGLLSEEQVFLNTLEDRNKTSHLYHEEESEKIFQRIKADYLPAMEKILKGIEQG